MSSYSSDSDYFPKANWNYTCYDCGRHISEGSRMYLKNETIYCLECGYVLIGKFIKDYKEAREELGILLKKKKISRYKMMEQ